MAAPVDTSSPIYQLVHSERAQFLMDLVPAAMIVIDERGIVLGFGKAAQRVFGYAEDEVVGQNVKMLMAAHHRERHDGYMRHYLETGEKRVMSAPRLEHARHADGTTFPIELTVGEIFIEGVRCFIGFLRVLGRVEAHRNDVRNMLAELAHASRVSAMGALATAIAHELNQPLTTIANYAEGLQARMARQEDFAGREEYLQILDTCSRQAIRAGQLLHRLREFVKGGEPRREPVAIQTLVNEAISLALINGYKRSVTIDTALAEGLRPVIADGLQVQQVLFNLVRNAIEALDAMPAGHLRLKISARELGNLFVEVTVEDNGAGIDPEIAENLFDSFVTTKEGGMGVGLAICKEIVEAHGGQIRAGRSSDLGGALFRFTLPAAEAAAVAPGE